MNDFLEDRVQDRTRQLALSQDVLEKLPIPVVGISVEGLVVVANHSARTGLPFLKRIVLGMHMNNMLPAEVASLVQKCLTGERGRESTVISWGEREVSLRLQVLKSERAVRGCIMVLEV